MGSRWMTTTPTLVLKPCRVETELRPKCETASGVKSEVVSDSGGTTEVTRVSYGESLLRKVSSDPEQRQQSA